jgi:hypothetical protein
LEISSPYILINWDKNIIFINITNIKFNLIYSNINIINK